VQDGKDFGFFSAAYVDSRYKPDYVVEPEVMDKLTGWVEAFQHWVYKECLKTIDEFVPEENFSNGYKLHFPLMDFEDLKVRPLVEDLLIESELKVEFEKAKGKQTEDKLEAETAEKNRAIEREEQALKEKELERLAKEQAREGEAKALQREGKETLFRYEVNMQYISRYEELVMLHQVDYGELPERVQKEHPHKVGRLTPLG